MQTIQKQAKRVMDEPSLRIVLASTSPFRKELLQSAGVAFTQCAPGVDEDSIQSETPAQLALLRARAKAEAASKEFLKSPTKSAGPMPKIVIIGCDQVLDFKGHSFEKATTAEEAVERLKGFSGGSHFLHSALSLLVVDRASEEDQQDVSCRKIEHISSSKVTMRELTEEEIHSYVATGEWQGCVGCYRIEGRGIQLFSAIEGEHSAIIGLPMLPLLKLLRQEGYRPFC